MFAAEHCANLRKQRSLLQTLEWIHLYISANILIAKYMLVKLAISAMAELVIQFVMLTILLVYHGLALCVYAFNRPECMHAKVVLLDVLVWGNLAPRLLWALLWACVHVAKPRTGG